jgi:hypothetical protein
MSETTAQLEPLETLPARSKYSPKYIPIADIIYYAELGLLNTEIADLLNTSNANISQRLTAYGYVRKPNSKLGIQYKIISSMINEKVLKEVKSGKIKIESLQDVKNAMISSGIAHEHYRLETDQSTANIAVDGVLHTIHTALFKADKGKLLDIEADATIQDSE